MSDFVVSARKYRPIKFEDVVGQQHVTTTLQNAIQQSKLAHAFLFCGPRGVGKTTSARILAKTINCQDRDNDQIEPCGECDSCVSFEKQSSMNIIELDAASNNSVENIRSLVDQVRIPPQNGDYKVFIIDEVHMLSTAAFNAFLKTLEEPPVYAIFILATTEKHKILPTILSRCQIFDFKRISSSEMVEHLKSICDQEAISYEEDALHIIARKADGALRDSLSIFDRVASYGSDGVNYGETIELLNVLDVQFYFQLVEFIQNQEIDQVLNQFNEILLNGFEGNTFIQGLMDHLRNLLIAQFNTTQHLLDLSENQRKEYLKYAKSTNKDFLLTLLDICNTSDVQYRMAENKRLHVEMALIKMCYFNQAVELLKEGKKKSLIRA